MAAIELLSLTPITTPVTHTGNATWTLVTAASLGGFTTNDKYLIIVNALHGGNHAGKVFGIRCLHGSTVFQGSFRNRQPNNTGGAEFNYTYWTVWTAVEGEAVTVEHNTTDTAQTVSTDEVRIYALNLSNLTEDVGSGGDWKFAEEGPSTDTHTTSEAERLSMLWTPGTTSQDWLMLSRAEFDEVNASISVEMFTRLDATATRRRLLYEGEDTANNVVLSMVSVAQLDNTQHDLSIGTRDDTTGANIYLSSAVFVLRLNAFESHGFTHEHKTTQVDATGSGTFDELATLGTYTPATTGDQMFIADVNQDTQLTTGRGGIRLQFAGVSDPAGWETSTNQIESYDSSDELNGPLCVVKSIASSGVDVDLDAQASTTDADFYDGIIVAFSMELPAGAGANPHGPLGHPLTGAFGGPI